MAPHLTLSAMLVENLAFRLRVTFLVADSNLGSTFTGAIFNGIDPWTDFVGGVLDINTDCVTMLLVCCAAVGSQYEWDNATGGSTSKL
jgi:hypothetical protein